MIDENTILKEGDFLIDRLRKRYVIVSADPDNNSYRLGVVGNIDGSSFTPLGYSLERLIKEKFRLEE